MTAPDLSGLDLPPVFPPAGRYRSAVIDGASDVFTQVFGERGEHARLAVGVSSLPANLALEVEAIIAVRP